MSRAFVLGNGVSRQDVDLNLIRHFGSIYGCNALYRDFTPTALVSTDRPISEHIQNSGYALKNRFYTRRPKESLGAYPVPQKYFGYSSGPIAVGIAAFDGARVIYLLGFDMNPKTEKFNNVYADTEFYKKSNSRATYTGNWVKQLCTIMNDFSDRQFVRVFGNTTSEINEFNLIKNYLKLDMVEFLNRINNKKDL
jgi:hypothetical protein